MKKKNHKNFFGASVLSTDFFEIKKTINDINNSDLDFIHFDIMDGEFVPNISMGAHFVKCIRSHSDKFFDVHLMLKNPLNYIEQFVSAGADSIGIHIESNNVMKTLKKIKKFGKKTCIVLNPDTSEKKIKKYLSIIDAVMIMTVQPGFGGQLFIENMVKKIKNVSNIIKQENKNILIEVDGGINLDTAKLSIDSGANVLVVGSYLFKQKNINNTVSNLKNI